MTAAEAMTADVVAAALRYAERGWPVFPCSGKRPLTRNGLKDATATDRGLVEGWWRSHPEATVAVVTGSESGLLVLDVDGEEGAESLRELERRHGDLPRTASVKTPRGGSHFYFRHPGGQVRNSAGKLGAGLDIRGDGGYVVAPPSSGYVADEEAPLADPPLWLLDAISGAGEARRNGGSPAADPIVAGSRNADLTSLAGTMRRRGMGEVEIAAALRETNRLRCEPPLADEEVGHIAASVARYEPAEGARATDLDGDGATPPAETQPKASRFIARQLADQLRSETPIAIAASGKLHTYRAGAYRPDGDRDLRTRIAAHLGDEWKRARADEVIAFLRDSAPRLWPQPPRSKINVANGILDLDTGCLAPHEPGFLSPVQIAAAFDPAAKCPAIDTFLADVLDAELVPVIHELAGYLVTPDNTLQVAVMLLGEGSNGKSTLLTLLTALVGVENVATVALHRLDEDRFSAAELEGKLANVFADLDARALQASSIFKAITGGDAITGERKYYPAFSFRPFARLLYSANEPPPTPDSSDAFFRRWQILPFERRFDGCQAERRILDRLTTAGELSGLLNYGIAALPGLLDRGGFAATASATRAAERFRVDSDSVAGFLGECCEMAPECRVARSSLFDAYRNWCAENNRRPLGKQRFNRRVEALHPTLRVGPVQGIQSWHGVELRGTL